MDKTILKNIGLFVAGAGVGYGVGYFLTKKKWQRIADEEIESVKARLTPRKDGFDTPQDAAAVLLGKDDPVTVGEAYVTALVEEGYISPEEAVDVPNEKKINPIAQAFAEKEAERNIFDEQQPTDEELAEDPEVLSEENAKRYNANAAPLLPEPTPDKPYAIGYDQFMEEDDKFDKVELLYYEGDDTLTDIKDSIVPDIDKYIGSWNIQYFGVGTDGDKNALYVRNEVLGIDFEVMREKESFAKHLGVQEAPVKNSPRKFREDDES